MKPQNTAPLETETQEAVLRYARGPYYGAALIAAVETGVFEGSK